MQLKTRREHRQSVSAEVDGMTYLFFLFGLFFRLFVRKEVHHHYIVLFDIMCVKGSFRFIKCLSFVVK